MIVKCVLWCRGNDGDTGGATARPAGPVRTGPVRTGPVRTGAVPRGPAKAGPVPGGRTQADRYRVPGRAAGRLRRREVRRAGRRIGLHPPAGGVAPADQPGTW